MNNEIESIYESDVIGGTAPGTVHIPREVRERARLFLSDIRPPVSEHSKQRAYASEMAPPKYRKALTDEAVQKLLEPRPVRWSKALIPNLRTNPKPETVSYYRYSTDMQEYSKEAQLHIISAYCKNVATRYRLPPASEHQFGDPETSGGKWLLERRGGGQMARYLRPGDHLVVAYFDRLGRNTVDVLHTMEALSRLNVHLHIVDLPWMQYADPRNPDTIRQIQGMASFAEFERRMSSRRTKNAYDMFACTGRRAGAMYPRGYKAVNLTNSSGEVVRRGIIPDLKAIAVTDEIYEKWAVDGWTIPELERALKFRNFRTARGRPWTRHCIRRLLLDQQRKQEAATQDGLYSPSFPPAQNPLGNRRA